MLPSSGAPLPLGSESTVLLGSILPDLLWKVVSASGTSPILVTPSSWNYVGKCTRNKAFGAITSIKLLYKSTIYPITRLMAPLNRNSSSSKSTFSFIMCVLPSIIFWTLWKDRCIAKYDNTKGNQRNILYQCTCLLKDISSLFKPKQVCSPDQKLTLQVMGIMDSCMPPIPSVIQ